MTKPDALAHGWRGRTGYIDAAFVRDALAGLDPFVAYVAGPPGLVQGVTKALLDAGVPQDNIRTEEFDGY